MTEHCFSQNSSHLHGKTGTLPGWVAHLCASAFENFSKRSHPLLSSLLLPCSSQVNSVRHLNRVAQRKGINTHCWSVFNQKPQHDLMKTFFFFLDQITHIRLPLFSLKPKSLSRSNCGFNVVTSSQGSPAFFCPQTPILCSSCRY